MKRILAVTLALVLCFSLSVTAFAQTDDTAGSADCDVSLTVDDTGGALSVKLEAYTAVTDGVVTITYDSAKLSIAEEDVTATTLVDMDSVNASQAGTLKISWISAEAVDGTLFDLGFSVKEGAELNAGSFAINGLVVDEDNNEVSLGVLTTLPAAAEEPPTEGDSETPSEGDSEGSSETPAEGGSEGGSDGSSEGGSEGSSAGDAGDAESTSSEGSAETGDRAPVLMISVTAVVVLAAMAAVAGVLLRRRTVKR